MKGKGGGSRGKWCETGVWRVVLQGNGIGGERVGLTLVDLVSIKWTRCVGGLWVWNGPKRCMGWIVIWFWVLTNNKGPFVYMCNTRTSNVIYENPRD